MNKRRDELGNRHIKITKAQSDWLDAWPLDNIGGINQAAVTQSHPKPVEMEIVPVAIRAGILEIVPDKEPYLKTGSNWICDE
jgi:hypothetical protein